MKVTNRLHLPEAFVKAVSVERHNKAGCYSATTLNKGVKEIILQERHWEEFTVDAADGDKWAVMRNGRKTAVRVFDTETDAENCAGELGNSHYVEHRPAVSRKCGKYCLCKDFCNFWKSQNGGAK